MGRAAACRTSSPQEALTVAAFAVRGVTASTHSLTCLRTASAWQADMRL